MDLFSKPAPAVNKLEADSIWLEYEGRKILQNIYIQAIKGQITGLLGRNGCGKSSLMKIIYGIKKAQYSSIRIDNTYASNLFRRRNLIAFLPQTSFLPENLFVNEAFKLYGSSPGPVKDYFPEIDNSLLLRVRDLSGGQQRLIETALILSSPAPFVLLDEPFSNLMPLHVERLMTWLSSLKKHKAILLTDHQYQQVVTLSDCLYLLTLDGRTIQLQNPLQELSDLGYIY